MNCFNKIAVILFYGGWCLYVMGSHFTEDSPCNTSLAIAFKHYSDIVRYDLESSQSSYLTQSAFLSNAIAIASDQQAGLVFFTDVQLRRIYTKDFKTPRNHEIIRQLSDDAIPDGIAVDVVNQMVVYTDTGEDIIASMDYDGQNFETLITADDGLDEPRGIVLDHAHRKMYYTDWGSTSHISRADYTGENIEVLQDTDLLWPNGITADFSNCASGVRHGCGIEDRMKALAGSRIFNRGYFYLRQRRKG